MNLSQPLRTSAGGMDALYPGAGSLLQGNLEQSNVNSVTEITNLIAAQRAYEMNGKVITAADQMLQSDANLIR